VKEMEYETMDYNRNRWNRTLLNGFWLLLAVSILLECLYITITEEPLTHFIISYVIKPTLMQILVLIAAEMGLRKLNKYHDYLIIFTSTLLSSILVFVHESIDYLLLALFLPVMISIFYFHSRKLLFAYCNMLLSVFIMYIFKLYETTTVVGLATLTVMFSSFTLISWGILLRGRELSRHLKTSFQSNQDLLVKTIIMDKLAKTDALTGLYNHMTFHEYFEKLIEEHINNALPLQLALIDIDNFKLVNDTYGHRAGDEVLQKVAEIINRRSAQNDFVARYGGEEFAVLFTDKTIEKVLQSLEEIRSDIQAVDYEVLHGRSVTVSIGLGDYHNDKSKEQFFNLVDEALYTAKKTGKNKIVLAGGLIKKHAIR
jgi:diguanylate cyclase